MEDGPISELPTSNSQLRKLVVLESTTYPGTTEEELRAVLEENSPFVEPDGQPTTDDRQRTTEDRIQTSEVSGQRSEVSGQWSEVSGQRRGARRMRAGVDFHLAFAPEREDPGNELSKVKVSVLDERFHELAGYGAADCTARSFSSSR